MLVGTLVVLLFVALIQLTLALHVRNVLIDSAADGARYGALDGNSSAQATARTRALIAQSLSSRYAADIAVARGNVNGTETIEVTVRAPLPLVWLYGPSDALVVTGRAVAEGSL
ncbi:TadE-like protein [Ruaniaceae bacterium KH17]|nr:TadE-like protein [Ruaniaceae bacterium KH17]